MTVINLKIKKMKPLKATINNPLNKEKSINFFIRYGYYIHKNNDTNLVLRKPGTEFTTSGEKLPKELSIQFKTNETEVSLKYDTFVLFDTGDLQKELDLILSRIKTNLI